jgi:hypothetical protein
MPNRGRITMGIVQDIPCPDFLVFLIFLVKKLVAGYPIYE